MKYIPFVARVLFVDIRNQPMKRLRNGIDPKNAKDDDFEQQSEDHVEFLCELTTSPRFVDGLKGTASMDMAVKTRFDLRAQEGKAKATGRWAIEDEPARRIKAAYDDFTTPPHIAQNYIEFGRALDAMSDKDPMEAVEKSSEEQLEEKARAVIKEVEEESANKKPPGGLRKSGS